MNLTLSIMDNYFKILDIVLNSLNLILLVVYCFIETIVNYCMLKLSLNTSLGVLFPYFFCGFLLLLFKIYIIVSLFCSIIPSFYLNEKIWLLIEITGVFIFSIPIFLFGVFFRFFKKLTKPNQLIKYSVFSFFIKNKLGSTTIPKDSYGKNINLNINDHPDDRIRMLTFNSLYTSRGDLPIGITSFIDGKIKLLKYGYDKDIYTTTVTAGKKIFMDRTNSLSYVLRTFPEGFVNLAYFKDKGIPLFDTSRSELIWSKSDETISNMELSHIFKRDFLDVLNVKGLPDVVIRQALADTQLKKVIINCPEYSQISKFLGILGDNIVEFALLTELYSQKGALIDILNFNKLTESYIDLQSNLKITEKYQVKNITFSDHLHIPKSKFQTEDEIVKFLEKAVYKVTKKYLTQDKDIKILLNLEAVSCMDIIKFKACFDKYDTEFKNRFDLINPKFYPTCSLEERATLIKTITEYFDYVN
jgi:hypothetical protein